jgi:hypothetical protein
MDGSDFYDHPTTIVVQIVFVVIIVLQPPVPCTWLTQRCLCFERPRRTTGRRKKKRQPMQQQQKRPRRRRSRPNGGVRAKLRSGASASRRCGLFRPRPLFSSLRVYRPGCPHVLVNVRNRYQCRSVSIRGLRRTSHVHMHISNSLSVSFFLSIAIGCACIMIICMIYIDIDHVVSS